MPIYMPTYMPIYIYIYILSSKLYITLFSDQGRNSESLEERRNIM